MSNNFPDTTWTGTDIKTNNRPDNIEESTILIKITMITITSIGEIMRYGKKIIEFSSLEPSLPNKFVIWPDDWLSESHMFILDI